MAYLEKAGSTANLIRGSNSTADKLDKAQLIKAIQFMISA